MTDARFELRPVATVQSALTDLAAAPKQADEGAPEAWLDDVADPIQGVFNTRSPARPNPIGLHELRILAIDGARVRVSALEALDGTPVLDVKPELHPLPGARGG